MFFGSVRRPKNAIGRRWAIFHLLFFLLSVVLIESHILRHLSRVLSASFLGRRSGYALLLVMLISQNSIARSHAARQKVGHKARQARITSMPAVKLLCCVGWGCCLAQAVMKLEHGSPVEDVAFFPAGTAQACLLIDARASCSATWLSCSLESLLSGFS